MLTSLQNPLAKQIRKLHKTKERRNQHLCLLEGSHLIEEACIVQLSLQVLCCTESWQQQYPKLYDRAADISQRVELVSPALLRSMATTVEPDGVIAIAPRQHQKPIAIRDFGLVLETIQDPGNLGTMIRTAAAVGVDGLLLSRNCVDLDNPKVLRASAGQWLRLPMAIAEDLPTQLQIYREQGMQVIATLPTAEQTLWDVDFTKPSLILMGNEGSGLSSAVAASANVAVRIPSAVGVESLNVSIAAALMLYEARRQRENTPLSSN
ncbi:RNA methyltransferase [filamentous cyanobacterium LEGE 11480]|uniref:RNA methyltransferase n=1 Tax=Romeriopsis navalis LEGE 11480 TaxID=2777977 RepID=A0A928VM15_9CYAN|nr:RNA methyltransferase [Romeriopsis navalis]MBE9028990.1 RNA methyltransferase [Romeriopsis navalis LEGE 11480]